MTTAEPTVQDVADWWATSVSRVEPNIIELRGRPIQEIIADTSFIGIIWLLLRAQPPTPDEERLLEAAMVASVDHGPHAPSIAVARMAATCGVGLNNAIASGINVLGDSHGGAGEQCLELLTAITDRVDAGEPLPGAAEAVVAAWRARDKYVPGFGHRFHRVDPRRDPLLRRVEDAVVDGVVRGRHLRAATAVEAILSRGRKPVPINIDGCTAVVYGELGFAPPLARGLFVLSRSVGILAHAWEETGQGRRNKGPIPPTVTPTYVESA